MKCLQMQKPLTFSSKNDSVYAIFDDQSFNDTLANDIVSFEQLGPVLFFQAKLQLWSYINSWSRSVGETERRRSILYCI